MIANLSFEKNVSFLLQKSFY